MKVVWFRDRRRHQKSPNRSPRRSSKPPITPPTIGPTFDALWMIGGGLGVALDDEEVFPGEALVELLLGAGWFILIALTRTWIALV